MVRLNHRFDSTLKGTKKLFVFTLKRCHFAKPNEFGFQWGFFFHSFRGKKGGVVCIDQRHGMFNGWTCHSKQNTYTLSPPGTYTIEQFGSQSNIAQFGHVCGAFLSTFWKHSWRIFTFRSNHIDKYVSSSFPLSSDEWVVNHMKWLMWKWKTGELFIAHALHSVWMKFKYTEKVIHSISNAKDVFYPSACILWLVQYNVSRWNFVLAD